jgi:hypothetical protein
VAVAVAVEKPRMAELVEVMRAENPMLTELAVAVAVAVEKPRMAELVEVMRAENPMVTELAVAVAVAVEKPRMAVGVAVAAVVLMGGVVRESGRASPERRRCGAPIWWQRTARFRLSTQDALPPTERCERCCFVIVFCPKPWTLIGSFARVSRPQAAERHLRKFWSAEEIWSSPLTRTIQTSLIALQGHPVLRKK